MILVNNIKLDISRDSRQAFDRALKALKLPRGAVRDIWVHKVSIDARKGDVKFVYSVAVKLANPGDEAGFAGKNRDIQVKTQPVIKFAVGGEKMNTRPRRFYGGSLPCKSRVQTNSNRTGTEY